MKRIIVAFIITFLAPCSLQAETMPDQLVRTMVDKVALLLRADRDIDPDDPRRLYAMMDFCEDVMPHIDFRAMSRFALGRYWREANEAQRARFTHEFRNLLVRTYGTALGKRRGQRLVYLPASAKPGDTIAIVKTEVRPEDGGPNIPINYHFYKTHSVWKLYDISIDGVSLVTTYHYVYADLLKKEGLDAMIASIARSNNEPPGGKGAVPKL